MDWSHGMKPGEIEQGVRAVLFRLTRRMRSLTDMLMDVADVPSVMMRPRKSLVAMRIARPQHRARASGFGALHITEK